MAFKTGSDVFVSHKATAVADRYLGRRGTVVGTQKTGRGFRFLVSMPQRTEPLLLAKTQLTSAV